jgi:L-alanine-DL-glutamate epimerase-like enolase superfamily enzyme
VKDSIISELEVSVYRIPTDGQESDGTIEWNSTTMVLVRVEAAGASGLGFSYASESAAALITQTLREYVVRSDAMDVAHAYQIMTQQVRNVGRPGIASTAISAVDIALWDLKAKLLGLPLVKLLGQVRRGIEAYGSGGFTSYADKRLQEQLGGWAREGFKAVKMKIGREPKRDPQRVTLARQAIGPTTELFVDANGAFHPSEAIASAETFADSAVTWFEEPVSSDDLEGLRRVRERAPGGMRITAGEYGYDSIYFNRMLQAGAVDVLQADATRCGGVSGFLQAAALCDAYQVPLSAHTAPSVHQHLCCACSRGVNVEYFYDHARIESMFFDGAARVVEGQLRPDLSRPGLGLELRDEEQKYRVR